MTPSNWFIGIAVLFIVLGTIAIVEPLMAGLALAVLVGWLLLIGGVTHGIMAFRSATIGRGIWQLLVGVIYAVGGLYFLAHPLIALGTLALFLAAVFFAEGILMLMAYFSYRGEDGAGWLLLNAAATLILSALIWTGWPSSSAWVIGSLVGINLLITGARLMQGGTTMRRFIERRAAA